MTVRTKPPTPVSSSAPASKRKGGKESSGSSSDRSSKPVKSVVKTPSRLPDLVRPIPKSLTGHKYRKSYNRRRSDPLKENPTVADCGPIRGTKHTFVTDNNSSISTAEVVRRRDLPVSEAVRRSANNLLDEIGGVPQVLAILDECDHPNAPRLADLLRSDVQDIQQRSFGRKILDAGMKPETLAEILYDRQKTRAFVAATMDIPEVVNGIVRRAKDRFKLCADCHGWGRKLTREQREHQLPAEADAPMCLPCEGVGYILVSGEMEAVELFLELVRLRKNGQQIYNDFSRKNLQQNQINNSTVHLGGPNGDSGVGNGDGQPPSIDMIIKRADEQRYLPAAPATSVKQAQSVVDAELMPEELSEVGE